MQSPHPSPSSEPIGGRYDVIESVGEGTFAVTYRARDLVLGRTVAVKILRAEHAADATFVSRFEREARLAAAVSDPNVVDVYDYGADAGTFYIAMQYVPGSTLKQELDRRRRFDAPAAVHVTRQILHGLAAIHAAGIVHRDIKPENVLLGEDGAARVTDFGVAHYHVTEGLTGHGTTVGTASYMAPEQARGGTLSPATDLYAVGVLLYELLTGLLPFAAESPMAVMLAHLQRQPTPPSEVAPDASIPPAIEAEVMRALAKEPERRPASADELSEALAAALSRPRPPTPPPSPAASAATTAPAAVVPDRAPPTAGQEPVAPAAPPIPRAASPILLPRPRPRRVGAAWIAPLAMFVLALGGLGALVAGDDLLGRDGEDNGPQLPALSLEDGSPTVQAPASTTAGSDSDIAQTTGTTATSTATATAPAAATSTPRLLSLTTTPPSPTTTAIPTATQTPEPEPPARPTLPPTETPTPSPTPMPTLAPTSEPTPTEPPPPSPTSAPEPTSTPSPTAEPVVTDPTAADPPSVARIPGADSEDEPPADEPPAGSTLFPASAWAGGAPCDPGWYGRPCVALYGNQGNHPQATLTFELSGQPSAPMVLTISGLGDDSGDPFPFGIEINGYFAGNVPRGFPNWDRNRDGAQGENAPWQSRDITIPAELFRQGENHISIVSGSDSPHSQGVPYLLLGEASLSP